MESESAPLSRLEVENLEHIVGSMKSFLFDYFQKLGPSPVENIKQLVNILGKVFRAAATLYNRLDANDGLLKTWAIDVPPPGFLHEDKPEGHVCYHLTIKERSLPKLMPVEIPDFDTTPFKDSDINVKSYNLKSYLAFPVALNGQVVGSLCVVFGHQRTFSDLEKDILESFAKAVTLEEERKHAMETVQAQVKVIEVLKEKAEREKEFAVKAHAEAEREKAKSEKLLLNILPKDVAEELKATGRAEPVNYDSVSVMFTDFKGFTTISETMSPNELIKELDTCFSQFDKIVDRRNLEKLKTIGDGYMCAGGIPRKNKSHPVDITLAALEIQAFMNQTKYIKEGLGLPYWELRLGIHSGPIVAGVIGERKFVYDVWGDTVNTASRMESSGTVGRINISGETFNLVKDFFDCEYRGKLSAKNKGEVDMYYVNRIKPELSQDEHGLVPNKEFNRRLPD